MVLAMSGLRLPKPGSFHKHFRQEKSSKLPGVGGKKTAPEWEQFSKFKSRVIT